MTSRWPPVLKAMYNGVLFWVQSENLSLFNAPHVFLRLYDISSVSMQDDLIPLLVSHGANLEATDGEGLRPVHIAARAGRHVAIMALLSAGADVHPVTPRRWNALHFAAAGGHVDTARLLVYWDADSGVLSRQKNAAEATPVDLARCRRVIANS